MMEPSAAYFEKDTLLIEAIQNDDCASVRKYLTNGGKPNAILDFRTRKSLLHLAVEVQSVNIVKLLVGNADVDITVTDSAGLTPLHYALRRQYDSKAVTEYLLDKMTGKLNIADLDGQSPLHYAIMNDHLWIARKLLDLKADVNQGDKCDQTPLHYAAYWGRDAIVTHLVLAGAQLDQRDAKGRTALDIALKNGHDAVACILQKIYSGDWPSGELLTDIGGRNSLKTSCESALKFNDKTMYETTSTLNVDDIDCNGSIAERLCYFERLKNSTDNTSYESRIGLDDVDSATDIIRDEKLQEKLDYYRKLEKRQISVNTSLESKSNWLEPVIEENPGKIGSLANNIQMAEKLDFFRQLEIKNLNGNFSNTKLRARRTSSDGVNYKPLKAKLGRVYSADDINSEFQFLSQNVQPRNTNISLNSPDCNHYNSRMTSNNSYYGNNDYLEYTTEAILNKETTQSYVNEKEKLLIQEYNIVENSNCAGLSSLRASLASIGRDSSNSSQSDVFELLMDKSEYTSHEITENKISSRLQKNYNRFSRPPPASMENQHLEVVNNSNVNRLIKRFKSPSNGTNNDIESKDTINKMTSDEENDPTISRNVRGRSPGRIVAPLPRRIDRGTSPLRMPNSISEPPVVLPVVTDTVQISASPERIGWRKNIDNPLIAIQSDPCNSNLASVDRSLASNDQSRKSQVTLLSNDDDLTENCATLASDLQKRLLYVEKTLIDLESHGTHLNHDNKDCDVIDRYQVEKLMDRCNELKDRLKKSSVMYEERVDDITAKMVREIETRLQDTSAELDQSLLTDMVTIKMRLHQIETRLNENSLKHVTELIELLQQSNKELTERLDKLQTVVVNGSQRSITSLIIPRSMPDFISQNFDWHELLHNKGQLIMFFAIPVSLVLLAALVMSCLL